VSTSPTFSELLDRARKGDLRARDELFSGLARDDEAGSAVLAMARRVLPRGDPARDLVESKDLVQSALRSGWLELSRFEGATERQLLAWLRTILRRKLGRHLRKPNPRPGSQVAREGIETDREDATAPPIDGLVREELLVRLREAIAGLSQDHRDVMTRRLRGLDAPAIAAELGLTPAAVRKRESRAMALLRDRLGESH
jgi:RNA polymerase sigma factor (sigma-70 family)